jgi:hypothetical protein
MAEEWKQVLLEGDALSSDAGFLDLSDTPTSYSGQQGKALVVNGTEDGLVFQDVVTSDELVKAWAGDTTAGYLDAKVDGVGITVNTTTSQMQLGNKGVKNSNIDDSAVDTLQISDSAVTTAKIDIDANLDFNGNQAENFVAQIVEDEAEQNTVPAVVGKMIFRKDLNRPMFCISTGESP